MGKRPFKFTTQEFATIFFMVGFFFILVVFRSSYQIATDNQGNSRMLFVFEPGMLLFIGMGIFLMAIGYILPCYQISRYNLNIFMDKLEQGFEGWLRFTKNRKFAPQIIKTGPLGQEKGVVSGYKADIINRGDFPVTLLNGNHAVIKYDLMSHNVNLNEVIGWALIVRKYGYLGSTAYKYALETNNTIKKEEPEKKEPEKDHKILFKKEEAVA
jgi:hypothetical protein